MGNQGPDEAGDYQAANDPEFVRKDGKSEIGNAHDFSPLPVSYACRVRVDEDCEETLTND